MPRHGGIHIIHIIHIHMHIPSVARPCMKTFTQDPVVHPFDHRTARQRCSTTSTSTSTTISRSLIKSIYLIHRRNCIRNRNSPHRHIKALPQIPPCRNPNLTRWHQVKHKSWRRRRRANHPAVCNRSRPVSTHYFLSYWLILVFQKIGVIQDRSKMVDRNNFCMLCCHLLLICVRPTAHTSQTSWIRCWSFSYSASSSMELWNNPRLWYSIPFTVQYNRSWPKAPSLLWLWSSIYTGKYKLGHNFTNSHNYY